MSGRQTKINSGAINLADIYHVLFRHKKKILLVWGLGLCVCVGLKLVWPKIYESEAKLYIRYVVDNKSISPFANADANIQTPDAGGQGIINSEVQMLNSFDLAKQVAGELGPTNIIKINANQKNDAAALLDQAALSIQRGLTVTPLDKTPVITLVYDNPNGEIVQHVLRQLIADYRQMHIAVHQTGGVLDEQLQRQRDELKSELIKTEEDLKRAKSQMGIISLEDAKKAYTEQIAKITQDLDDASAELAEHQAAVSGSTNLSPSATEQTNTPALRPVPADKLTQYEQVTASLRTLHQRKIDLLADYLPESAKVQEVQRQIAQNEKIKEQLEQDNPQLVQQAAPNTTASGVAPQGDLFSEQKKIAELESRIHVRNQQYENVHKQMIALIEAEGNIVDLEAKRSDLDRQCTALTTKLNNAQYDDALGPGRVSNISTIEEPIPPLKAQTKLQKILLMTLGGAVAGGIALAFCIELYLDRSFKRAGEIESSLQLPLFLSIPNMATNGKRPLGITTRRLLPWGDLGKRIGNGGASANGTVETAPWSQNHHLRPFFETLRDRVIMSFEARNITRNPKLVAVTSCAEGSGASTVASGLAACLSEAGGGNVLLVDMNTIDLGAAQYFRRGKLEVGIDGALEKDKRANALVQENLYLVAETPGNGQIPQILHKRFSALLPKLKASDYDYIIFDMPPVSQISSAPKLARFMDIMFMVVEAEKTDRDVVKRAVDLLAESKTEIGIVLNKEHNYVPRWLSQRL